MIRHIISWTLKDQDAGAKADAFERLAEGFRALPALIPEISSLDIARDLDETPGNWDVVLIVDYESRAALEAYQVHPEHERVKALVGSLVSNRAAIDFEF
jgi:quinol monooxygenase YgiN